MRIISGTLKGRRIFAPKSSITRPTSDRVRESLFSIIGEHAHGANILDLFAGTGALGLEALSRSGNHCVFVEKNNAVIKTLERNLELVAKTKYTLFKMAALQALKILNADQRHFDLIFLDPPYQGNILGKVLPWISENQLLRNSGVIICEHLAKKPLKNNYLNVICKDSRIFGDTALSFFEKRRS